MNFTAPIAVVAAAGIFPGACNLNLFWQNILGKVDAFREVSPHRWIVEPDRVVSPDLKPDKAIAKRCAPIEDFDFHPAGLDIHLNLAALDPLYHLVLQVGRDALTADLAKTINRKRTGVILAAITLPTDTTSEMTAKIFGSVVEKELFPNCPLETFRGSVNSSSREQYFGSRVTGLPAALLAKAFSLGGGTCTLDAACASSLYAVKLACNELHAHRADAMLAGGISRPDCLFTQVGFSQLKALSPSGRCAPFADNANGLVVGEGAGLLVLKRLADALRDQNPILGLIHGIGLSNDMRGNLLAPDSEGQLRAMRSAYESCGWFPWDVDLIECHGAGTPLGDLTELESLRKLWGDSGWTEGQCAIGSVKSMIGHLLTAAGAAGMIKILLALQHKILPPSLNFCKAPPNSPLHGGPFRVQTEPEEWHCRNKDQSRRAAISAFGFGGINAHLLLEEWNGNFRFTKPNVPNSLRRSAAKDSSGPRFDIEYQNSDFAIVGMAVEFGSVTGLRDFRELIIKGATNTIKRPAHRWKGSDEVVAQNVNALPPEGGFMSSFPIAVGEFHIPPKEIPDILPQQLLMLKVAAKAILDAGLSLQGQRPHMGAIIGIDFDFEAANFHLRWYLESCMPEWLGRFGLKPDDAETKEWVEALKNTCSPPLTATRTLGALGSMVASRVAREFRFGGPSFAVSCEAASGLKALAIGMSALQRHEADGFLIAAVDLCGDIRNIVLQLPVRPFSQNGKIRPFDRAADGTLPGEGAAALIIKRRDQAIADGDRIYAVIKSLSSASGAGIDADWPSVETYVRSLADCCRSAHVDPATISLLETHGSGIPSEDNLEAEALQQFFEKRKDPCALGSVKANIGHSGAVAALASLVKTSLCLYHEIIPPLVNFTRPANFNWSGEKFYFPRFAHHWARNPEDGPRRAMIATMTSDGNCMHTILEGADNCSAAAKQNSSFEKARTDVKIPDSLIAERMPVNLSHLNGDQTYDPAMLEPVAEKSDRQVTVTVGGNSICPPPPSFKNNRQKAEDINFKPADSDRQPANTSLVTELMETASRVAKSTAEAHQKFLALSEEITRSYAGTFNLQTKLLEHVLRTAADVTSTSPLPLPDSPIPYSLPGAGTSEPVTAFPSGRRPLRAEGRLPHSVTAFSREECLEFARGSIAAVLGPEFAVVDTYRVRVRLPDEPLMLVDRILSVEGQKGSLGSGRIITEHDVQPDAWYLDGGHAPVFISVEAGQADLFLSAYLGIDLKVQGSRTYRLLDATVKFHRELPRPGEIVRYEIEIEKFIRQGDTYLFLFHFKGFIGSTLLITMTHGCAGFFSAEEVKNSGGIILTEEDRRAVAGKKPADWQEFVPLHRASYDDAPVQALRTGNLSACFGEAFEGINLPTDLRLPDGRMKLIDRIVNLDPYGGRFGAGLIQSEADIHPAAWFLTCHFVDDMVMPGTLMYECCAQTLRVFMQRIGWVTEKSGVFYEPVRGIEATLKCRGPVTPQTQRVTYEVEIKEMGYRPEPYVIADAYIYADGRRIVFFRDMSLQMSNITREEIESEWQFLRARPLAHSTHPSKPVLFDRSHLLEFAAGQPSRAFGYPYEPFDRQRFIARLPQPPYLFIDRIVKAEPKPWVLKPDGWIEAECDVDPNAWYFRAERTPAAPISIILEMALQPCGWLAAYMGSALRSAKDLRFRNLGGHATLHGEILPDSRSLTMRCRLTQVSEAADMIIEHYDFEIQHQDRKLYAGNTYFGFFTAEALAQQQGFRDASAPADRSGGEPIQSIPTHVFSNHAPLWPEDSNLDPAPALAMPSKALRMIDRIETYLPDGGPAGLGFVSGSKTIDPQEWFFNAHFFQDPVCPGSLGIEAFVQLLKFMACHRWPDLVGSHRFALLTGQPHRWSYRGQIIPQNQIVTVEAAVCCISERPWPSITANGHLQVDGLTIYRLENFGICIIPATR